MSNDWCSIQYSSYGMACDSWWTKHFLALVLACQIVGGFNNLAGFLWPENGNNHYNACCHQKYGHNAVESGIFSSKYSHMVLAGCCPMGVLCEVEIGFKSGKRYSNKIDQVVSGKSHGQWKGTKKYYNFENINFKQIEDFNTYGCNDKTTG